MFAKVQIGALMGAALVAMSSRVAGQAATDVPPFDYGTPSADAPGVVATNPNGETNPDQPMMNTPINQTSMARLASLNSVDDWCTFSSPDGQPIANVESITVAYCTKPRNNARVIPDGTVTAAHFVKTPLYVQIMALGDFTKIGIPQGDYGGELDPHGATNMGNPIGGNVTSNVSGEDVFYEEWMNFISYEQLCMRVCIAGSDVAPTPLECQHTLDEMGCNWVMPGDYSDNKFDTCDGDAAYPPGLYPQGNGMTSTFQQFFSSVASGGSETYVNGSPDQATPSFAYSLPATSNCQTTSSISNGVAQLVENPSSASSGNQAGMTTSRAGSGPGSNGGSAATEGNDSSSGAGSLAPQLALGTVLSALIAGVVFLQ